MCDKMRRDTMRPDRLRQVLGLSVLLMAGRAAAQAPSTTDTSAVAAPDAAAEAARRKQVVAKVQNIEITLGKVEDHIATQAPMLRTRYNRPDELKKLVDNLVRFELLAAEATRQGYDKNLSVVRTIKESTVQNLMRTEIDEKVTPQAVPAEEVKAYYDGHPEEFHRAAMRRASHVLYDTEAEAKAALAAASKLDQRGFSELAKKDSKDLETRLRGGDLGYFSREPGKDPSDTQVHPALRKAAFELKTVGDTTKIVAIDQRFSILRLTGERPERHTELAEAEPSIRTRLWREKRETAMTTLVETLRAKEKPQTFPERVDLVKFDDMDKGPTGFAPEPAPRAPAPQKGGE
jgi:peptidyl-prolyl cis-trans isomerase C